MEDDIKRFIKEVHNGAITGILIIVEAKEQGAEFIR